MNININDDKLNKITDTINQHRINNIKKYNLSDNSANITNQIKKPKPNINKSMNKNKIPKCTSEYERRKKTISDKNNSLKEKYNAVNKLKREHKDKLYKLKLRNKYNIRNLENRKDHMLNKLKRKNRRIKIRHRKIKMRHRRLKEDGRNMSSYSNHLEMINRQKPKVVYFNLKDNRHIINESYADEIKQYGENIKKIHDNRNLYLKKLRFNKPFYMSEKCSIFNIILIIIVLTFVGYVIMCGISAYIAWSEYSEVNNSRPDKIFKTVLAFLYAPLYLIYAFYKKLSNLYFKYES